MNHNYADCSFCGGKVKEKRIQVDYRQGEKLMIFENVPVGVCGQCGERYYTAKVAKALERMLAEPGEGTGRTITVPVRPFDEKMVI